MLFRSDPKEEQFYTKDTQKYLFEIIVFKNKISDLFKIEVHSKIDLFSKVDAIYDEISAIERKNAFIGILFGGSLSHFLYTLALASIHLPYDDMQSFWQKAGELYEEGMEKMVGNLREILVK